MSNQRGDQITYSNKNRLNSGSLAPEDRTPDTLKGAELLGKALQSEGVDTVFGYPGGANLEIFDVLPRFNIRCIRTEHEQGAIHAAQGFARASGKVGVCIATSGPGATNLVTGIADANSDSTAVVAITGNVPSHLLGKNAFQEVDIVAITQPITKKSSLLTQVYDIPSVVREAFALAGGGRPGPVLIDIPKDIQQQYPLTPDGLYHAPQIPAIIDQEATPAGGLSIQLSQVLAMLEQAERPIIYAGGGIASAGTSRQLQEFAERFACPVTTTIMGLGTFPPHHHLSLGPLGMHGSKYANDAINEADLVLAMGVRFDDRVTGNVDTFIEHGKIIHIDIDRNELNKNKRVHLAVEADIKCALDDLLVAIPGERQDAYRSQREPWLRHLDALKKAHPFPIPESQGISPQQTIAELSRLTEGNAIVSMGVGQHQMWAMQHYQSQTPGSFLSSSGFGTMGFGLPAAIGAKIAAPERLVIDIDGDGSLNMTVQELACCHRYQIGVKIIVINNQWLGMVRQWQDMIYDGHRATTDLTSPHTDAIYPNFLKIAEGYGITAERVSDKSELTAALQRLLQNPDEPYLLDVIVEAEENVYPMIPAGGSYRDIMLSDVDRDSSADRQGSNI